MALTTQEEEGILMMKVKITSAIKKLNESATRLSLMQQRLVLLEKTEPTDAFGDNLTDTEITKFHFRAVA